METIAFTTPEVFIVLKTILEEKGITNITLFDITEIKKPLFSVNEMNKINSAEEIFIHFNRELLKPFEKELAHKLALRKRNKEPLPNFYIIYDRKADDHPTTFKRMVESSKDRFLKNLFAAYFSEEFLSCFEETFSQAKPAIFCTTKNNNFNFVF